MGVGLNYKAAANKSQNLDYSVFYTLSDIRGYHKFLDNSLKSVERFVEPGNIIVVYTPPINEKHIESLRVRGYQIYVKPTPVGGWRFAAKNYLCDVETENLIFIDCDTVVYKDIRELLTRDKDYSFAARIGKTSSVGDKVWEGTFKKFGLRQLPMFNSGFMIFRDGLHNCIKDEWIEYLKMYLSNELELPHKDRTMINQHALTLAISRYVPESNIWYLGKEHHSYGETRDTYVFHTPGSGKPLIENHGGV